MKKWIYFIAFLLFVAIIIFAIFKNTNTIEVETTITNEYTPEEEISEEQNRQTLLTLYFVDPDTNELIPEVRRLDVKEIIDEPYEKIMNLLLEGSENEMVGKTIPEGTTLNSINLDNETLIIDLSSKFVEGQEIGSEKNLKIIYSIVNTFLELQEVSSVMFLVDGESVEGMSDRFSSLNEV